VVSHFCTLNPKGWKTGHNFKAQSQQAGKLGNSSHADITRMAPKPAITHLMNQGAKGLDGTLYRDYTLHCNLAI